MDDTEKLASLKRLIRKQIAEVRDDDGPKSMHEKGVALAKAASASLKSLENLRSKAKLPSKKAQDTIDTHIHALEHLFNDMWQSPLSYLDATPDEIVLRRRSDLDDREMALDDGAMRESMMDDERVANVVSFPTHCSVCGTTYDKKLHPACPKCEMDAKDVRVWIERLKRKSGR